MRRITAFLAATALIFVSSATAQDIENDKPKLKGSGNVVTRAIPVQSFDELNLSGIFSVLLSQDGKEEVRIEAEDNLQDLFEVKNEGSRLLIRMKKNVDFKNTKKMKVYVSFKKLKTMDLKTVGDISSEQNLNFDQLKIDNESVGSVDLKLTAQSLNIDNKSVGNVKLSGKADNVVIKNKSVGSIQASAFVVQKMDIDHNGIGSAEVNAEKELKVKDSFLGKVKNKGSATARRMNKVVI